MALASGLRKEAHMARIPRHQGRADPKIGPSDSSEEAGLGGGEEIKKKKSER
jgi:hypothetical protein